jgi:hypothetical protein
MINRCFTKDEDCSSSLRLIDDPSVCKQISVGLQQTRTNFVESQTGLFNMRITFESFQTLVGAGGGGLVSEFDHHTGEMVSSGPESATSLP